MDVTKRCDYACRILRAAYRNGSAYRSVADIAEEEGIPYAFARSIQHDLTKAGLVKTVRGARGGLALACDPNEVTLLSVLEAVQGPLSMAECAHQPEACERRAGCAYNGLWRGADTLLRSYFASITLAGLLEQGEGHPVIQGALRAGGAAASGLSTSAGMGMGASAASAGEPGAVAALGCCGEAAAACGAAGKACENGRSLGA